jgi:hypothetical protein
VNGITSRFVATLAGFQARLRENSTPPAFFNADGREIFSVAEDFESAPMAFNPDAPVTVHFPSAAHPNCARMRTRSPVAANPDPPVAPFPIAANPDESRIGRRRNNFDLRRWRCGLIHDNFGIRRGIRRRRRGLLDINRTVAINDLTFHAAAKQWQRNGNQGAFQNGIFHIHNVRRVLDSLVTYLFVRQFNPHRFRRICSRFVQTKF